MPPAGPDPAACARSSPVCAGGFGRAARSAQCAWWGSVRGYPGHQRPRNQLCSRLTGSQILKEVHKVEKGTGLILGDGREGRGCEGKIGGIFLRICAA